MSNVAAATEMKIAAPLLTVVIPTYKRARYVESQVQGLIVHFLSIYSDVEVVVVNNKSPDDTKVRLEKFLHENLRIINLAVHYDTAEENMMRALQYVRGDYVWFLGDDEVINPSNIDEVMSLVREARFDCLVFNSPTVTRKGSLELMQPLPMHGRMVEASIGKLIELIGLLYTFAGFSNLIHRTSKLDIQIGLEWMNSSRIYSHVAWFIESHKDSKVALVNLAAVFYRQNDYSDGHWDRVAEKLQVQNLYFWSLGIARLLDRLARRGALTYVQAGQILEVGQTGNRYKLINDLVMKIYQQIAIWMHNREARQSFTAEDISELYDFCISADPSLFDILQLIRDAHEQLSRDDQFGTHQQTFQSFEHQFREMFVAREAEGQFLGRYVGRLHGYDAYHMPLRYVGVLAGDIPLREGILSQVDSPPDGLKMITADDLDELTRKAEIAARRRSKAETRRVHFTSTEELSLPQYIQDHGVEARLIDELARRDGEIRSLNSVIQALLQSSSWALTGPLRAVASLFKRKR